MSSDDTPTPKSAARLRRNTGRLLLRGAGILLPTVYLSEASDNEDSAPPSPAAEPNFVPMWRRRASSDPPETWDKAAWDNAHMFGQFTDAIGHRITLKHRPIPSLLQTTTGYIDSVSLEQHQLILRERPNSGELRLVAIDRIESYSIVDPAKPDTMPLPVVPLTAREIETRVAKSVASEAAAREHFGKDVDKSTQELYDALRRILPDCKWSGKSFIVNSTALVEPPYGVENVKAVEGVKGAEKNVQYVKRVVSTKDPFVAPHRLILIPISSRTSARSWRTRRPGQARRARDQVASARAAEPGAHQRPHLQEVAITKHRDGGQQSGDGDDSVDEFWHIFGSSRA